MVAVVALKGARSITFIRACRGPIPIKLSRKLDSEIALRPARRRHREEPDGKAGGGEAGRNENNEGCIVAHVVVLFQWGINAARSRKSRKSLDFLFLWA